MSPKKERLVDFYQAAERAGVGYGVLWRGAAAGFFRTVYLGGRRLIPESELDRIIEHGFGVRGGRGRPRKQPKASEAATT